MNALTNLNNAVAQLKQNAAVDGITIAALMIIVYAVIIMFNHDNSPQARTQRWEHLHRVLICAAIITGAGALVQFATGFGSMLG
jgi:hypothetical protein